MKESPFIFGNTVSTLAFTDGDQERKKIKQNLLSGINTVLHMPSWRFIYHSLFCFQR
jgi:hypothetical protein